MKTKKGLRKYKLDTSALFYPIMATKKAQSLFRLTVTLCDQVDGELLRQAIAETMERFPVFKTRLRMGYAWHYLGENTEEVKVFDRSKGVLKPINPKETNGYLFRVVYEGKSIILEMFHGICDGTGASIFFKGFLQRYRQLQGVEVDCENAVDLNAEYSEEENEDAFKRYYTPIKFKDADIKSLTGVKPQLITGTVNPNGYTTETYFGTYSQMGKLAKERGVSFTAFVAGVMAYSIAKVNYGDKPIVVMVPVNLRAIFPSKSMRNFTTFVRIVFDKNDCADVEECIREASVQLTEKIKPDELKKMLGTTVRSERTLILKIAPLWLKVMIAKFLRLFLKSRQTIIISNLGRFNAPDNLGVENAVFNVNVSKNARTNVAIMTSGDRLAISFTKTIVENHLADMFVSTISKMGGKLAK